MRLDIYLTSVLPFISRNIIKTLIRLGFVKVNGELSYPSYKLKLQDKVDYDLNEISSYLLKSSNSEIVPLDLDIDIVYEDKNLLVVNKSHGLDVHPVPQNKNKTLLNALVNYFQQNKISSKPRLINRIDKDTSGIVLVAKNYNAHVNYSKKFLQQKIHKYYLALVEGHVEKDKFIVNNFLGRSLINRKYVTESTSSNGKFAITEFHKVGRLIDIQTAESLENILNKFIYAHTCVFKTSLLEFWQVAHSKKNTTFILCKPITGRTHQIRVHLASVGLPIVGDKMYGFTPFSRMMLHSWAIGFD